MKHYWFKFTGGKVIYKKKKLIINIIVKPIDQ